MSHWTVEYSCEDCGISITGESWDPAEAPELYCPDCGKEMELDVERK